MAHIIRRKTPAVRIGTMTIGSDFPVLIQSMTDTPTADVAATVEQTLELVESGCELVRWTINDDAAAKGAVEAIGRLRAAGITTPIAGDFHFNGHLLLQRHPDLAAGLDKYRINPGNVGRMREQDDPFSAMIKIAVDNCKAVRIGVNWGSLDRDLLAELMDRNTAAASPSSVRQIIMDAIVQSALESARRAIECGLPEEKLVISAKLSVLQDMIEVYERLACECDYVLHLGLTEAGSGVKGVAASAAALAILLQKGIGDTIRVSLTPEPGTARSREVTVCQELLQAMGLRYFIASVTSCPGCGRTKSAYFQELAGSIREYVASRMTVWRTKYKGVEQLKIAVMGCVVNGPGESRHADIGISLPGRAEAPSAPVYINGEKSVVLKGERIKEEFIALLEEYVVRRFGA